MDRWVGTENGCFMRREAPKDAPCSQRLEQHLPLAGLEAIVPPEPWGKALWCQCQAGCAPSSLGMAGACSLPQWVTPDWVGLGLLCSPAQDHAAGGGCAVRGCVGRHNEDVCELHRAGLPTSIWGAGEGIPRRGCQAGVPRGLVPHSAPACCAGVRG